MHGTIGPEAPCWADRSKHWGTHRASSAKPRRKRERESKPLILRGHGISLKVDKGTLVVKNGFTHHPQAQETYRFFRGHLDTPQRIIILDGSGQLSFAVLDWLHEQNIALVRIAWDGKSFVSVGQSGSPTSHEKLKWQLETASDADKRFAFCQDLLLQKLGNAKQAVQRHLSQQPKAESAIADLEEAAAKLRGKSAATIADLLSAEGLAARPYFEAWRGLKLKWTDGPVPPQWLVYDQRSSILTGKKPENYKAAHPINAMLNYAYAVLEAEIRIEAIAAGYDPRIGILHVGNKRGKDSSLVFDLMEPKRPLVDAAVLDFAMAQTFSVKDFVLRKDGVCRLSPMLAAAVAGLTIS